MLPIGGAAVDSLLLAVRLAAFLFCLFVGFGRLAPWSVRLAVLCAALALGLPLVIGSVPGAGELVVLAESSPGSLREAVTARALAEQMFIGTVLGVAASFALLSGLLFASWSGSALFSGVMHDAESVAEPRASASLRVALCGVVLLTLFPGLSRGVELVLSSVIEIPPGAASPLSVTVLRTLVESVGTIAFHVALLASLPVFASVCLSALVTAVLNRVLPSIVAERFYRAALIPALSIVIGLGLLQVTQLFEEIANRSVPRDVQEVVANVR